MRFEYESGCGWAAISIEHWSARVKDIIHEFLKGKEYDIFIGYSNVFAENIDKDDDDVYADMQELKAKIEVKNDN